MSLLTTAVNFLILNVSEGLKMLRKLQLQYFKFTCFSQQITRGSQWKWKAILQEKGFKTFQFFIPCSTSSILKIFHHETCFPLSCIFHSVICCNRWRQVKQNVDFVSHSWKCILGGTKIEMFVIQVSVCLGDDKMSLKLFTTQTSVMS